MMRAFDPTRTVELARFRFRPRFRGIAASAALIGALLLASAVGFGLGGSSLVFALIAGGVGLVLGGLYLISPAWRLEVTVDDEALEVRAGDSPRFRLPWAEIERVVASPETKTCFIDGGLPERSLLVPGPGAQAPYAIERRDELFDAIIARAPAAVVETVPALREARPKSARKPTDPPEDAPSDAGDAPREEPR